jgi:hypothetical protein
MTVANPNVGATPSPPGSPYLGVPVGYQQIAAATLASATSLTVPVGARYALIQVDTASVRFRDDGTAPTAAIGVTLVNGIAPMMYTGDLATIQFIALSGSPVLNVSYYR